MTLANKAITGRKARAYYNSGTFGSPVWVELTHAKDVETPFDKAKISISDRASVWDKVAPGQKSGSAKLTYRKRRGTDAAFDALLDSYVDDVILDLLILDGAVDETGAMGWRFPAMVHEFSRKEGQGDVVEYSFGCEIADTDSAPGTVFEPVVYVVD